MIVENPDYIYTEIIRLDGMLKLAEIPHDFEPDFGGYHIFYPSKGNCRCSAIEHNCSYGRQIDRIEIMGLLTAEEKQYDDVIGSLTAEEVFDRIKRDYEQNNFGTTIATECDRVESEGE